MLWGAQMGEKSKEHPKSVFVRNQMNYMHTEGSSTYFVRAAAINTKSIKKKYAGTC